MNLGEFWAIERGEAVAAIPPTTCATCGSTKVDRNGHHRNAKGWPAKCPKK